MYDRSALCASGSSGYGDAGDPDSSMYTGSTCLLTTLELRFLIKAHCGRSSCPLLHLHLNWQCWPSCKQSICNISIS